MENRSYISVILPLKLEWEPCYSIDKDPKEGQICIGERVKVRFANKEYVGVVSGTEVKPEVNPEKIRPILSKETGLEKIRPEEIALWRAVSEYYMCSVGEVYKAAYPTIKVNLEEAKAAATQKVQKKKEKMLAVMAERICKVEERLVRKEDMLAKAKEGTKTRVRLTAEREKIQQELNRARTALEAAKVHASSRFQKTVKNNIDNTSIPSLSTAQHEAYEEICKGFTSHTPILLNGVTGSGKTEIYIRLAKETMGKGQNVLYLVPEIALSRQLEDRLYEHFSDSLMIFHSGESAVSRRNTAERIRHSENGYIVLGTRSSLFLPHHDLGLIIVDEEHDVSYKQDSPAPRYNGRDTALMLAVIQSKEQAPNKDCNIILGSATPSLEELYNCQVGRHIKVVLKERYHGESTTEIELIDTKAERKKNGMVGNFSRKLIERISLTLQKGEQVMLLRSRRALAPSIQCDNCGEMVKCPHCNVSLSLHKKPEGKRTMICHYCGYKAPYSGTCSKCKGNLKNLGAGTQKIEEEVQALFPKAKVARLDSDTRSSKAYEIKTIKGFDRGDIDILIGTQMLSKGFDFSRLSLVAVIAADSLLGIQDFRADEKALQLLEQFKGRCGRRGQKSQFIIQTSQPEHPVYQSITNHDSSLATSLLNERKDFMFPPYSRIVELTIKDIYEDRAERMSGKLASKINLAGNIHVTGPYSPVIDKIADMHIRIIRISLPKDRYLKTRKSALFTIIKEFEKDNRYDSHIIINADPS